MVLFETVSNLTKPHFGSQVSNETMARGGCLGCILRDNYAVKLGLLKKT